jgi:hypothetical protein
MQTTIPVLMVQVSKSFDVSLIHLRVSKPMTTTTQHYAYSTYRNTSRVVRQAAYYDTLWVVMHVRTFAQSQSVLTRSFTTSPNSGKLLPDKVLILYEIIAIALNLSILQECLTLVAME